MVANKAIQTAITATIITIINKQRTSIKHIIFKKLCFQYKLTQSFD